MMNIYEGKSVFHGVAIGRISVYKKDEQQVKRVKITDAEAEITRFEEGTKRSARWGRPVRQFLKYIR